MKNIITTITDLFAPNDPVLVEKTLARISEQDTWNDVFSTKLIELLDNIEPLKIEIRQRMRSLDSLASSAIENLERAERAYKYAAQSALDAKVLFDRSTVQLRTRERSFAFGSTMWGGWTAVTCPPVGRAELAHHANNLAWDIAIHDAHGHLNEVL